MKAQYPNIVSKWNNKLRNNSTCECISAAAILACLFVCLFLASASCNQRGGNNEHFTGSASQFAHVLRPLCVQPARWIGPNSTLCGLLKHTKNIYMQTSTQGTASPLKFSEAASSHFFFVLSLFPLLARAGTSCLMTAAEHSPASPLRIQLPQLRRSPATWTACWQP